MVTLDIYMSIIKGGNRPGLGRPHIDPDWTKQIVRPHDVLGKTLKLSSKPLPGPELLICVQFLMRTSRSVASYFLALVILSLVLFYYEI